MAADRGSRPSPARTAAEGRAGRAPDAALARGRRPRGGRAGWAVAALLALGAGCGYKPLGTEALPGNIRTIAVGPIANSTFRAGLQGFLGDYLNQRFRSDGRLRVRPSTEADAVIETTITSYGAEGVAWDRNGVARRFRVQVTVGMNLRERQTQRVLVSDGLAGEAYFTAGEGVGTTLAAEEAAARRALRDLADRVLTRIIEGM